MTGAPWRAFGGVFLAVAGWAILGAWLEAVLTQSQSSGGLKPLELLYAANAHLLLALIAVSVAFLLSWVIPDRAVRLAGLRGPGPLVVALALFLATELGGVAVYWISQASFTPPTYSRAGKLVAAGLSLCGLVLALLITGAISRAFSEVRWKRFLHGRISGFGVLLGCLVVLTNSALLWNLRPDGSVAPLREDARDLERPDLLIILVDTLRRDHLSYFGYPRPTSPNIDRLFEESYVFSSGYTPSSWTVPSVASLFTGLYPSAHRIDSALIRVPDQPTLLAEEFASYGYQTAAFVGNDILTGGNGYSQGFETFFPPPAPRWVYHKRTAFERVALRLQTPASVGRGWKLNTEALAWYRNGRDAPRFAYIHYLDPHSPYQPPEEDLQAVAPGVPSGPIMPPLIEDYADQLPDPACRQWETLEDPPSLPPDELAGMIARYDGEIHLTDRRIGQILGELDALGFLDRTHVLFMTDHGEEFGDHSGWFHGSSVYEEMVANPMAYRPPGGLRSSELVERPAPALDLIATVLSVMGLAPNPSHQGRLIPEIVGEGKERASDMAIAERPPNLFSLRWRHWKLVRRGPTDQPDWRLYNLKTDPAERVSLASSQPDTLAYLKTHLEARLKLIERGAVDLGDIESAEDPELIERLRSLGYIR